MAMGKEKKKQMWIDGATLAIGIVAAGIGAMFLFSGCSSPTPNVDLSNVNQSVDQAIDTAKQGVDAANELTDKANKLIDLGQQVKDVMTK